MVAVGGPAINPVPRKMMTEHLGALAAEFGYAGGFEVAIGVENGEALALKTMNPRLGILGGLSILGTTGIVRPFSCSAYIASIHQAIDVARANGIGHVAACTGNASEDAMRAHYGLADIALIEMGDFAGAVLKHLKRAPVARLSMCGGFGKLSKLAAGHLDLHSRTSSIDLAQLAAWARDAGAGDDWREVDGWEDVVAALAAFARPLFTLGREPLAHLDEIPAHQHWLVRCLDAHPGNARAHVLAARGPFTPEGERALFATCGIDVVVSKNSGGAATEAKLAIARERRLPVVMLRRPALPGADRIFHDVASLQAALTAFRRGSTRHAEPAAR
jgi:hypothetical protein